MNTKLTVCSAIRWIGLADVRPMVGNELLGQAKGAVVAVVADAQSVEAFFDVIRSELASLGFVVRSLEDVEPLVDRRNRTTLPTALVASIEAISLTAPLALGSFHSYRR